MFKVTYAHRNSTEHSLYIPGNSEYTISSGKLELAVGESGQLTLDIPDTNPAKSDIVCLTDEIIVYRDGNEIWRGRAVTTQSDFYLTSTLTCEGILSYLYDSYMPPYDFSGSPAEFVELILDNHNTYVEPLKQFTLGNVTVTDANEYITRSSIYYDRSLDVLADKCTGTSLGGYFRVRIENGFRYLDYLEKYDTTASQAIAFGSNILDIAQNVEYQNVATVILPLGAKLTDDDGNETDEYLTIADVNNGSIFYEDTDAVKKYGWIVVEAEWEDVTEASNLLTKAKDYLAQVTSGISSFEVNAIDLSMISDEYEAINLGDYVLIQSEPHGVNQYVELTSMTIDLLSPENNTLSFGTDSESLTDSQRSSSQSTQSALNSLSMHITQLTTNLLTTEYLSAKYATIEYLTTYYLDADTIEANYIDVETLEATYATITSLDAVTANITTLNASVANIETLLAGNAGIGTLEVINLSSGNTVIADATITDAMIVSLTASKLTAGTIYTSYIKIASDEDENLLIDGSTIQISDGTYVRVQIGKDGTGDYNLYLWDETGNLMWDAGGVTESGVNDGIIKDMHVASNAAISGEKLDIQSVATCLMSDGTLQIDASSVIINDTTLQAAYKTVTTVIEGVEAGAVSDIFPYFAVGDSDSAPPSDPSTDSSDWGTDRLTAGEDEYLWYAYYIVYLDGSDDWSTPICATDGYVRTTTSTLVTDLSVVQGEISTKVSQTDFNELNDEVTAISDKWTTTSETVDGLVTQVGEMETTVGTLTSSVNTLEQTATTTTSTISSLSASLASRTTHYGTCSSYPPVADKEVECDDFELYTGAVIYVKFTWQNLVDEPTLNVNDTGAYPIYAYGDLIDSDSDYNWVDGAVVAFVFDGEYWQFADSGAYSKIVQTSSSWSVDLSDYATTTSLVLTLKNGVGVLSTNADYIYLGGFTITENSFSSDYFTWTSSKLIAIGGGSINGYTPEIMMSGGTLFLYVSGYTYLTSPIGSLQINPAAITGYNPDYEENSHAWFSIDNQSMSAMFNGEVGGNFLSTYGDGSAAGYIGVYQATGSYYWEISGENTLSGSRVLYLPQISTSTSTLARTLVAATNGSATGSTSVPVYVDKYGLITACDEVAKIDGSNMIVANGTTGIRWYNTSGSAVMLMRFVAAFVLGNSSYDTYLYGDDIYLYGTSITTNVTITSSSDAALKHDIEDLSEAYVACLDAMQPVRFKYNEDSRDVYHNGYIAGEVLKAALAAGLTENDIGLYTMGKDGYAGLAYSEFIPMLHAKIKQLEERIVQLEATA